MPPYRKAVKRCAAENSPIEYVFAAFFEKGITLAHNPYNKELYSLYPQS
jgi:hypothetical protein